MSKTLGKVSLRKGGAMNLKEKIRYIQDFPKKGILFRDITPLLEDPKALKAIIKELARMFKDRGIQKVAGVESRGFIFGTPLAIALGVGFVPIRKAGKLPAETIGEEYALEYGTNRIEIHKDAIHKGEKVLLVDDLLATGGTMEACCKLTRALGGHIAGIAFVIELRELNGRRKLKGYPIKVLIED